MQLHFTIINQGYHNIQQTQSSQPFCMCSGVSKLQTSLANAIKIVVKIYKLGDMQTFTQNSSTNSHAIDKIELKHLTLHNVH